MNDPRAVLGDFLWALMVAGFKAVRYAMSTRYRHRAHLHWQNNPGTQPKAIRRMIVGLVLDGAILWLVALTLFQK